MPNNVMPIGEGPKDTHRIFSLELIYTNGDTEKVECSLFGTDQENPDFVVFYDGDPDEEGFPFMLVSVKSIFKIKILTVMEVGDD